MGVTRKQSTLNFPKNEHFLLCVSGGKKCSFFGKFGVLYFLVTPVLRFAFLPYCRRKKEHFGTVVLPTQAFSYPS